MNKLNSKGFTLVELLATIVIIGVISAIAMVSIDSMIDNSQITECENLLLSIKSATKDYVSHNRFGLSSKNFTKTVNELVEAGFLSEPVTNPFDKTKYYKDDSKLTNLNVSIVLNDDYTYKEAIIKNAGGLLITCAGEVPTGYVRFPG